MSPAEVRQVGGQPAGRGAECGWDGAGKCTPGLDSPGQQSSSRAGASTGRKREQCGRWGVLSAPDARRLGFLWYIQPQTAYSLHHVLTSTYLRIKSATDVQMLTCFRSNPGESCLSPASLLPL